MSALESGRFLNDALERAGRPAVEPVDLNRLREFADVARFFRIEAESQLPKASRPNGTDVTASSRARPRPGFTGRFWTARHAGTGRCPAQAGHPPTPAPFSIPASRSGSGHGPSAGGVPRPVGEGTLARFAAVRSHIERMASLEDGRSLRDALARAGPPIDKSVAPAPPREFAEVARFFRLEALWELERIKSR